MQLSRDFKVLNAKTEMSTSGESQKKGGGVVGGGGSGLHQWVEAKRHHLKLTCYAQNGGTQLQSQHWGARGRQISVNSRPS